MLAYKDLTKGCAFSGQRPAFFGQPFMWISWRKGANVWHKVTSPRVVTRDKKIGHAAIDIDKPSAHGQIGMLTPAHSRTRPRCSRCKLRQSSRASDACPGNSGKRCTCCDLCRRECALDAKGSQSHARTAAVMGARGHRF